VLLIGLDAASQRTQFGYAVGYLEGTRVELEEAGILDGGNDRSDPLGRVLAPRLAAADRALVAIDAPLGWPQALAASLAGHRAGERVVVAKDELFRRRTDRVVAKMTGKRPLEVAADRIARAAHEALSVLAELAERSGRALPLVWAPDFAGCGVIEVYPAATLRAHDLPCTKYKAVEDLATRRAIAQRLKVRVRGIGRCVNAAPDAFDACLCLLCALDFVENRCLFPPKDDQSRAEAEGWIWVRAGERAPAVVKP
jgi:hypothetical protein